MNQTAKPATLPSHSAMSQNSRGFSPEQRVRDHRLRRFDLVQELFVFGEFAHQRQHDAGFVGTRAADG